MVDELRRRLALGLSHRFEDDVDAAAPESDI
jgi:hypothetical protein